MKKETTPSPATPVQKEGFTGHHELGVAYNTIEDLKDINEQEEMKYRKLEEENRKAKMQIADLIEALTPFAEMTNEITGIKLRQGGEVFQYNDKKLMTSDFVRALDLIQYLSHHQIK